jgi:hypothetical protein
VLDAAQRRLDLDPEKMAVRRCTAEHPFGTLKSWMGATHFLTRTMERVSAEMSLHVLAYNIKRMIKIMGIGPLLAAIRAHGEAPTAFLCAAITFVRQRGDSLPSSSSPSRKTFLADFSQRCQAEIENLNSGSHFSTVWTRTRH